MPKTIPIAVLTGRPPPAETTEIRSEIPATERARAHPEAESWRSVEVESSPGRVMRLLVIRPPSIEQVRTHVVPSATTAESAI
jgi:hypothetical protein